MSLDERLATAARHVAGGVVPPDVDLDLVRARARSNRRRTTSLAVATSVVAVVAVAATAFGGRATSAPPPPLTSVTPTPSQAPTPGWSPGSMTPQVVVESAGAQLQLVGVAPGDPEIRLSVWEIAGYRGMALTTDGYRTTRYAAVPDGATRVVSSPQDGVFLLSDGSDKEWLVEVGGTVRQVDRVTTAFTPTDPRLWFQCVYGSWRSRWCSLDLTTASAHVSTATWGGSAVRPGLGVSPWGAHPEPRAASTTGKLEAWWFNGQGRQVRTVAQARDGDYVLGMPVGEMALWAPGTTSGVVDIHTSRDGGASWSKDSRVAPEGAPGRRVIRAGDGALLMCSIDEALVVSRAEASGGPFQKVYEAEPAGGELCSGLATQGGIAYLTAGDVAAVSTDDGRTWTTIETWR